MIGKVNMSGLLDTHYPKRPASLEEVCLYDFVANYNWQSKDLNGDRKYSKLRKPRLPNHKLFDYQHNCHPYFELVQS